MPPPISPLVRRSSDPPVRVGQKSGSFGASPSRLPSCGVVAVWWVAVPGLTGPRPPGWRGAALVGCRTRGFGQA
eukprot:6261248-Alexandrium_andersonii.AAC.1